MFTLFVHVHFIVRNAKKTTNKVCITALPHAHFGRGRLGLILV